MLLLAVALPSAPGAHEERDGSHDAGDLQHESAVKGEVRPDVHPEMAVCRACELRGSVHGEEKVVAHRKHEDATYYFCSQSCAEAFDAFPEAYVAHPLPRPAPEVTLTTLDGRALALSELDGQVVLVDFWATWCKPCIGAMPKLSDLQDSFGDGLRVVGVSIDEKGNAHVRKFLEKHPTRYDVALDEGEAPAWHAFAVAAIPAMFLIDQEGQIVAEWRGRVEMEDVAARVRQLVGDS